MFLGQHKRHEVDFAKSPGAQDTVVAFSTIFLIVRAIIESKVRLYSWGCIAYTKCLIAVPIPPFWTPFTYDAAIIPDKKGSSEKLSKLFIYALVSRSSSTLKIAHSPAQWVLFQYVRELSQTSLRTKETHSLNVTGRTIHR